MNQVAPSTPPPRFYSRTSMLVIFGVSAVMLVIGSIADLSVSTALYEPDVSWANLLAAIGEWPAGFGLIVAGVFLVRGRNKTRVLRRRAQAGAGGLLVLLGTAMVSYLPTMYLNIPAVVIILAGMVLSAGAALGTWALTRRRAPRELIRFSVGLIVVIVGEMIIINLIKIGWSRPRMRMLEVHSEYSFNPWWIFGSADKADALGQGISSEEFKSFPSGHTANAAILLYLAPMLAWMSERGRRLIGPAVYVGLGWALAVAASRIVMGAHFLTDVTVGLMVTFLAVLVTHFAIRAPWRTPVAEQTSLEDSDA